MRMCSPTERGCTLYRVPNFLRILLDWREVTQADSANLIYYVCAQWMRGLFALMWLVQWQAAGRWNEPLSLRVLEQVGVGFGSARPVDKSVGRIFSITQASPLNFNFHLERPSFTFHSRDQKSTADRTILGWLLLVVRALLPPRYWSSAAKLMTMSVGMLFV